MIIRMFNVLVGSSRRPERYSPNEVASFIRGIDPSFDTLAARFLQEVRARFSFEKNKSLVLLFVGNRW